MHPATKPLKESSFQAQIERTATLNGWTINLDYTEHPELHGWLLHFFRGKVHKLAKFLLHRLNQRFSLGYHTHDSRRSQSGFPDLVLVHPTRAVILFAELKTGGKYPSTEQRIWLAALSVVANHAPNHIIVRLWYPRDGAEIIGVLGPKDPYGLKQRSV